jgi:hypothetical protein
LYCVSAQSEAPGLVPLPWRFSLTVKFWAVLQTFDMGLKETLGIGRLAQNPVDHQQVIAS